MSNQLSLIKQIWFTSKGAGTFDKAISLSEVQLNELNILLKKDLTVRETFSFSLLAYVFVFDRAEYISQISNHLDSNHWDIYDLFPEFCKLTEVGLVKRLADICFYSDFEFTMMDLFEYYVPRNVIYKYCLSEQLCQPYRMSVDCHYNQQAA